MEEEESVKSGMRKAFFLTVAGGICIALGGIAYLSVENTVVGAVLFTVGLFAIVTGNLNLFTGRACFLLEHPPAYLLELFVIWLGNLVGAGLVGYAVRLTRIAPVSERAALLVQTKLADTPWSVFLLAVFCNVLLFVAVMGFRQNEHEVGKYIGLFLGVVVFILCGFEHCVANMFYFSVSNLWSGKAVLYLVIITFGNLAGAVLVPLIVRLGRGRSAGR